MDGRKLFVLGAFALGSCLGCVPSANKDVALESQNPPPETTTSSLSAMNLFGEQPKKRKNVELSWAVSLEMSARQATNQPEKQSHDFDEARKVYHVILEYDPNCIDALRGLGRVYIGLYDFERAAATFKKATEKQPTNAAVWAEHSIVYSKRNNFPEAIRLVSKAAELDPENQEYQRMLAVDYVCNGQIEQGIAAMTRARGPSAAHYYVARVYERKGQPELARQELAKALQANPNLQEARAMLEEMNGRRPNAPAANQPEISLTSHEQR